MADLVTNLFSGLIGAVIGGLLSAWGSVRAVRAARRDLDIDEIRRQRISCLMNLMGLRFALVGAALPPSPEDRSRVMFELNRAVGLWAHNIDVTNLLRDVRVGQTAENVARLLRAMSEETKQPFNKLSESDIQASFIVRAA